MLNWNEKEVETHIYVPLNGRLQPSVPKISIVPISPTINPSLRGLAHTCEATMLENLVRYSSHLPIHLIALHVAISRKLRWEPEVSRAQHSNEHQLLPRFETPVEIAVISSSCDPRWNWRTSLYPQTIYSPTGAISKLWIITHFLLSSTFLQFSVPAAPSNCRESGWKKLKYLVFKIIYVQTRMTRGNANTRV